MFEDNVLEGDGLAVEGIESPQSVPTSHESSTASEKPVVTARARSPHESPAAKAQAGAAQTKATGKGHRANFLRRRPIVSAIGAMLLAAVLGGGYLYLDDARHFQSTDDAFIAARQSSLAPKVSGYLTTVPVTDNQHVKAGDAIARIDDRDYRTALDQAEAQVAAAQASVENIDAQLDVQQAQIAANQAQVDQAQAALVFASSRRRGTSTSGKPAMAPFRTNSNIPRSSTSSRLRLRAHRRP
jgi:membrane fusion protein, multidrug efflux system